MNCINCGSRITDKGCLCVRPDRLEETRELIDTYDLLIAQKDREIADLKDDNIAWATKHFEEMAEKDRDSLALRHKLSCLTAALNDDERADRVAGTCAEPDCKICRARRVGIADYRAMLKEAEG